MLFIYFKKILKRTGPSRSLFLSLVSTVLPVLLHLQLPSAVTILRSAARDGRRLNRSWRAVWRPDLDRSRWSAASHGSRRSRNSARRCNARWGCTSCRTLSWCRRQCPGNPQENQSSSFAKEVISFDMAVLFTPFWKVGSRKCSVELCLAFDLHKL